MPQCALRARTTRARAMPRFVSVSAVCRLVGCRMARPICVSCARHPGINAGAITAARGAPVNRGPCVAALASFMCSRLATRPTGLEARRLHRAPLGIARHQLDRAQRGDLRSAECGVGRPVHAPARRPAGNEAHLVRDLPYDGHPCPSTAPGTTRHRLPSTGSCSAWRPAVGRVRGQETSAQRPPGDPRATKHTWCAIFRTTDIHVRRLRRARLGIACHQLDRAQRGDLRSAECGVGRPAHSATRRPAGSEAHLVRDLPYDGHPCPSIPRVTTARFRTRPTRVIRSGSRYVCMTNWVRHVAKPRTQPWVVGCSCTLAPLANGVRANGDVFHARSGECHPPPPWVRSNHKWMAEQKGHQMSGNQPRPHHAAPCIARSSTRFATCRGLFRSRHGAGVVEWRTVAADHT